MESQLFHPALRNAHMLPKYPTLTRISASYIDEPEPATFHWQSGDAQASCTVDGAPGQRSFQLRSEADGRELTRLLQETPGDSHLLSGSPIFDAMYTQAVVEARENSVESIANADYNHGLPVSLRAFETGKMWSYVWTRDLAYSIDLALGRLDPERCVQSLFFKASSLKHGLGTNGHQVLQDTGSGGSYPVSTDRAVWALGLREVLPNLESGQRAEVIQQAYPKLRGTILQDRKLIFDPADGLYRGEQSFLDWREQTYPGWVAENVLAIAMSKSLSTNVLHFTLLETAAELAATLGREEERARFTAWAADLKAAINRAFYNEAEGSYAAFLLTDSVSPVCSRRRDLLGTSLAILLGVADPEQARRALANYPVGEFGPPVVWPQESTVPIYHNHAIWPFVTAYWTKAARQTGSAVAVNHGLRSLFRGAILNLSNMENLDWVTGAAHAEVNGLAGPVINSPRQLWSVAGYLSLVQEVIYGWDTLENGVSFDPFVTGEMRQTYFGNCREISLRNLRYRGKQLSVKLILPESHHGANEVYSFDSLKINGYAVTGNFIPDTQLADHNEIIINLGAPSGASSDGALLMADFADPRSYFSPRQPEWSSLGQNGIVADGGRLTLHFRSPDHHEVRYHVYRDGEQVAEGVGSPWTDPESADFRSRIRQYTVEAVDTRTGNRSHLSPAHSYLPDGHPVGIPVQETLPPISVPASGQYLIRLRYANGAGPINTGLACAVKRLEIRDPERVIATAYIIMPQTGSDTTFQLSSSLSAELREGEQYTLLLSEDDATRNMTYLARNEDYTARPGGGPASHNEIVLDSIQLFPRRLGE